MIVVCNTINAASVSQCLATVSCLPCMSCMLHMSSTGSVVESACRGERALLKNRSVSSSWWRTGTERWSDLPQRWRCSSFSPGVLLRFCRLFEMSDVRLLRAATALRLNRGGNHLSVPNGVSDDASQAEYYAWCLFSPCQSGFLFSASWL